MEKQLVTALQQRLKNLGWYTGKVDGQAGALTKLAISNFKRHHHLNPRVFVGEITLTRLFDETAEARPNPSMATAAGQPWMTEARRLLGTRETPGKASNKIILDWADDLDLHYSGDDVPWCGLFVAHCMATGAPMDAQDFNRLVARQWLKFGRGCEPQHGAILVFWRGSKSGWSGHVGFYTGEDGSAYHVLGGNQSDAVTIARVAKDRLLGVRWPKSFAAGSGRTISPANAALSLNEA